MLLLIDKPKGITSHGVVHSVRKLTGEKKVGHAGTLDPNATGLLIVGIGRETTKKLGGIALGTDKAYEAEIVLGEKRDTDDVEGVVLHEDKMYTSLVPTKKEIEKLLSTMQGKCLQMPPQFSAKKVGGKVAYKEARKGKSIKLEPKEITIHSLALTNYEYPLVLVQCSVSSGTYIRSIARDLGDVLGCGAYLGDLRRTKIGSYSLDEAVPLQTLTKDNWKEYSRTET